MTKLVVEFDDKLAEALRDAAELFGLKEDELVGLSIENLFRGHMTKSRQYPLSSQLEIRYVDDRTDSLESRIIYVCNLFSAWSRARGGEPEYSLAIEGGEKTGPVSPDVYDEDVWEKHWIVKHKDEIL